MIVYEIKCSCCAGVKSKVTTCHRADDESEVGIGHCDSATEPTDTVACNTQACDPRYIISITSVN